MTYNVFGGTLNPAQSNPIHPSQNPKYTFTGQNSETFDIIRSISTINRPKVINSQ